MARRQRDILGATTPVALANLIKHIGVDPDLVLQQDHDAIRMLRYGPGLRALVRRVARPGESEAACVRRCIADDLARSGPHLADPRLLRFVPEVSYTERGNFLIRVSAAVFTGVRHRARVLGLGRERYVHYVMARADWIVAHGGEIPDDPEAILRAERVRY